MENAAEALKIAFAIMLFVMALTLSISSFSQATLAVQNIIELRDRETQYTYVNPTVNLTRTVGIETVISTMYRAYKENIVIYFFENDGTTPIYLYKATDSNGDVKRDELNQEIKISSIDFATESFANHEAAREFLDVLIGGYKVENWAMIKEKYRNKLIGGDGDPGLYEKLKNSKFEEQLGEYYQGTGTTKIKKRVITYILQP